MACWTSKPPARSWFQPERTIHGSRRAAVTQTIGAAAAADRSKAREVSPIQMAAMIYYNRGVDLLSEKRFAEAARANAKALRLDPQNATARGNLLGDDQQLVDRLGQFAALCRGGGPVAARAGHGCQVRALRPKLRPRPPSMGRPVVPREAGSQRRARFYLGRRPKCPAATISARRRTRFAGAGRKRSPPRRRPAPCPISYRACRAAGRRSSGHFSAFRPTHLASL